MSFPRVRKIFKIAYFLLKDASDKFATVEKKQVAHDKAIFGAKWQDLQKREVSDTGDSELYIPESKREVELAGPKVRSDLYILSLFFGHYFSAR